MGERDLRIGDLRRGVRLRTLVVRSEALVVAAALLVVVGPLEGRPTHRTEVVAATTATPLGTAGAASPTARRRPRVVVIGDSLIAQSADEQRVELEARGYEVEVWGSRGHSMATAWIQDRVAEAAADPDVDVVVLATAANDNFANAALASDVGDARALAVYRWRLRSTLQLLGDRCVVLVDARDRTTGWFAPKYAPKSNAVLREVAAGRPRTEVVAWSDISRPEGRNWFAWDLEHFSGRGRQTRPSGAVAYADAIADGVHRCPTR